MAAQKSTSTQEAPEFNPANRHWDDEFNAITSQLKNAETAGNDMKDFENSFNNPTKNSAEDAAVNRAQGMLKNNEEQGSSSSSNPATAVSFANKTSPKAATAALGRGGKALSFFKKRSAAIGIAATLAGAATFPFLGALSLPFSLFGNLTLQSVMQGASQYMEDYTAFRIFGNKTSVAFKDDKMVGLTGAQIEELEKNGVKLNGPTKTITGKTVYDSIEVGGNTIKNADEFKSVMRANPGLRSKVIISKPSLWKSAKSTVAKAIQVKEKVNTNPTMEDGTPQEEKQQILKDIVVDDVGQPTATTGSGDGANDVQKAQQASASADAAQVTSDFSDQINAAKEAVSEGLQTPSNTEMDNIPKLLSTEAPVSKNLLKTVWNATLNPLSLTSDMCTAYQIADTANTLARVFVAANLVRLALNFRASVEKVMAGDGDPATLTAYMDILNTKNPSTGESFDQSAAAQAVFNNTISGDPLTLTALGGAGMAILYSGMRGINTVFGAGSAAGGRKVIKSTCNIANNLGVQVTALVGSVAVGVFTGGASAAVQVGATEAGKIGAMAAVKKIITDTVEKIIKSVAEKGALTAVKDLTKDTLKAAVKKSWTAMKDLLKSPRDLVSLALVGTQTFAMGYIVDAITGGNIANALYSGTSFISGVITGSHLNDYQNAIGSGATPSTIPTATAYLNDEYRSYQQSYVAYMQDQARSTPFDYTNQYSALGSAVASFQKTFGTSAFSSVSSSLTSLASLPSSLGKMFFSSAYADSTPDLTAVNEAVANQFYSENNVAVQITGTPLAIFNKTYTFEQVKSALIDNSGVAAATTSNTSGITLADATTSIQVSGGPQISYDGDDETTGEPKLSIIPGSKLEAYRNKCHNADNTELDDMFQEDPTSPSNFNLSCMAGHSGGVQIDANTTISANEASLYDDAISFITQITPSASETASTDNTGSTPSGTCPTGTSIVNGVTTGWNRDGSTKDITLCSVPNTKMDTFSYWKNSNYKGSSSLGIDTIAVNSEAAAALKQLADKYQAETGNKLHASIAYRSVWEQCSFFAPGATKKNTVTSSQKDLYNKYCAPGISAGWLKGHSGNWTTSYVTSNHELGYSVDFTDSAAKKWLKACVSDTTDGKKDNRCYGFYDDVWQKEGWDEGHFTYAPT